MKKRVQFTPAPNTLGVLLKNKTEKELIELGIRIFSDNEPFLKKGQKLYLFPKHWYNSIPDGYEIVTIFGKTEKFKHGKNDNDARFGMLSFGFIQ